MPIAAGFIFALAFVPYVLAWKYILQLIRDVNSRSIGEKVSVWRWQKGWKIHRQYFPLSSVRRRIASCIAFTLVLGLTAFCIAVRNAMLHR